MTVEMVAELQFLVAATTADALTPLTIIIITIIIIISLASNSHLQALFEGAD